MHQKRTRGDAQSVGARKDNDARTQNNSARKSGGARERSNGARKRSATSGRNIAAQKSDAGRERSDSARKRSPAHGRNVGARKSVGARAQNNSARKSSAAREQSGGARKRSATRAQNIAARNDADARGAGPLVHLIDTHIYIFRAWSVLPAMPAPDGRATGAAYGFANTLINYLRESGATHLACCADAGARNFRHRRFPGYQESRGVEPPPELAPQFAMAQDVARALGLAWFSAPDYEADDVIATLTTKLYAEGARVRIVSADKDLMQLVTEDGRVTLYDLQRDRHYDADGVRAKFGVAPAQMPDYLALLGDTVDNLPGVRGFGKKSAARVLQVFGTLDALPTDARDAGDTRDASDAGNARGAQKTSRTRGASEAGNTRGAREARGEQSANDTSAWDALALRGAAKLAQNFAAARAQALEIRELATVVRAVPGVRARARALLWRGASPARMNALCDHLGWGRIRARAQSLIR